MTLVSTGAQELLKELFNADDTIGTYYVGLMSAAYTKDTTLAAVTGILEPTIGVNGYARIALARNNTDWPDIAKVNGIWRARSKQVTFTAAGGSFDKSIQRAFLASVASGAGILIGVGGLLPAPVTLLIAQTIPMKYEHWMM